MSAAERVRARHGAPAPLAPRYGSRSIAEVLTSAAATLGAPGFTNALNLPSANRVLVVLIDGLGQQLLKRFAAHAPFLRSVLNTPLAGQAPPSIDAAFPSTTASSLACLGTGLPPGQHGMVGYDVRDPESGRVVNQLGNWDARIDPEQWQPNPTVFERLATFTSVTTVSLPRFESSAMTRAALRGSGFAGAAQMPARIKAAVSALQKPGLVYFYANDLDKAGHQYGMDSPAFVAALEDLDHAVKTLSSRLPKDTLVLVTGDHGLIDIPASQRLDIGAREDLLEGISTTAGEPRMLHLFLDGSVPGEDVMRRWLESFPERIWALSREEAIELGYFGEVHERVQGRIGDVLILARAEASFFDTSRVRAESMSMVGQHGALTKQEREVPLLLTRATGPKAGHKR